MNLRFVRTSLLCSVVLVCSLLHAATRYVSHTGSNTLPYTTWETAANTIEAANIATIPGDTMFVDTGSFQLTQTVVLPSKITLRGKGMDSTIILGDPAIVDMFKPGDSTYVEDIYFRGNNCFRGLSKYRYEGFWSWWVTRCKFTNFLYAPITCSEAERVDVSHCWFGGWGDPGAIAVTDRGNCTITNCTFYAPNKGYPICSFSGNRTGHEVFDSNAVVGGGLGISGFNGEMKYNLFYGKSDWGGVVYGGVAMEVAFNSFYMDTPWIVTYTDILTINCRALDHAYIYNNIFAGRNPRVIFDFNIPDSSDIRITYNCFYSNRPMTRPHIGHTNGTGIIDSVYGNVYADPMFVDQDNGDLRLQKGSPCIDAGAPWILDVDGTRSDIGAFGGPGGSFYVYQDFPPKTPAKMDAFWFGDRVVVRCERNSESDFTHYVLFRSTESNSPLDSAHVLNYLDRLARPINVEPHKPPIAFGEDGRYIDPYQYIPVNHVDDVVPGYYAEQLLLVYYTDRFPIDTVESYYTLVAVDSSGLMSSPATVSVGAGLVPAQHTGDHEGRPYETDVTPQDGVTYELEQNYPNPFNTATALVYNLPNIGAQPAPVRLAVYNLLGQQTKSLIDEKQQPGRHIVYWDGTDQQGQPVASGVYFYRLEVSGVEFVKSGKMILMK